MDKVTSIEQLIAMLQRQATLTPGAKVGIIAPDETYWTIERPPQVDSHGVFLSVGETFRFTSAHQRFTTDNTTGYDTADLVALNIAFNEVCRVGDLPSTSDDLTVGSILDHVAEAVLMAYEAGARGEALVTAGCQGSTDANVAKLTALINEAAPRMAVVFAGREPRLIGTLETVSSAASARSKVDLLLLSQRLSATRISIATCGDQRFILAHG